MIKISVITYDECFDLIEKALKDLEERTEVEVLQALKKTCDDFFTKRKVKSLFVGEIFGNKVLGYYFGDSKDFAQWCWKLWKESKKIPREYD